MTPVAILSAILSIFGISGLALAGRGGWHGWALNLAAQPVWFAFAFLAGAWPLVIGSIGYTVVFAVNLRREWRKRARRESNPRPVG